MLGSLIPCDGGPPIGLSKPKLSLKLRSSTESSEGRAELLFTDGIWTVTATGGGPKLQINDNDAPFEQSTRLLPNDVLTVGRHRYRITYHYHPPHPTPPPPAPKPVVIEKPVAPRPVETLMLGMLIPCAGGRPVQLRKQHVVVGRAKDCDVVLPIPSVSSRHCELCLIDGHWQAVDLDSRNGTFVDGQRYQVKWLFPGNVLGFSSLRFRVEYLPQGDRPRKDDDVPVMSKKSLLACVGLNDEKLNALVQDEEDSSRKRWFIE